MITLKQLRVFVEAAKSKSVSIAASKSYVSQSAASRTISQLEAQLEKALFDRGAGKELRLTNAGKLLYPKAVDILDKIVDVESLNIDDKEIFGEVTIGASVTIADYVLPSILPKFQEKYPMLKIRVIRGLTEKIRDYVEDSICDIGLVEGTVLSEDIKFSFWKEDFLEIICSDKHPFAIKEEVTLSDISNANWAAWEVGAGTRDTYINEEDLEEDIIEKWGLDVKKLKDGRVLLSDIRYSEKSEPLRGRAYMNRSIVLDSAAGIKNYVASSSTTIGCLSRTMLENALNNGIKILNIKGLTQVKNFYIMEHKFKDSSYATKLFAEWVREYKF